MYKTYKIFDCHTHIFPESIAQNAVTNIGKYYHIDMHGSGTVDALIESGREIGVDRYIVHSSATRAGQVKAINSFIADVVKNHENMVGFGTLHAQLDDLNTEVQRIISLNLRGIKLHPEFQNFFIDDASMLPVYREIEGKLPLLIHMGDENQDSSSPLRLARILDMFPKLVVIGAHFGGYRMWDQAMEYLIGRNLYLDTSSSLYFLEPSMAVEMIRKHGAEKFLFGTDFPMWNHKEEIKRFFALDLSEKEKRMILYDNAARLLA